jgi:nucleotide-binding universal stress UspA family protein
MYRHILIPVENSRHDQVILDHIRPLAKMMGARLTLVHVADGWVARNFDRLNLRESDEIQEDRAYLDRLVKSLSAEGFSVDSVLALGEPADEILRVIDETDCDLVAMTTHGHRFISDLLYGSTANAVRHRTHVPVLLLKAPG